MRGRLPRQPKSREEPPVSGTNHGGSDPDRPSGPAPGAQSKPILVAQGVWGTLSRLPEPAILFSGRGFTIHALNLAAEQLFERTSVARVRQLLESSLTQRLVERICLASRPNAGAFVSEVPAQLALPDNRVCQIKLSVLPMAAQDGEALAVLYFRRLPDGPMPTTSFATLPREILALVPVPAWLVDKQGVVVFQNPYCHELPLKSAGADFHLTDLNVLLTANDGQLDDECALAFRSTCEQAAGEHGIAERTVTTMGQVWRLVHLPVTGVDGQGYLLGLGLQLARNLAGEVDAPELADTDAQRRRRMQIRERERERTKLAREVHDSLGQELTVLRLGLDRFVALIKTDLPLRPVHLEQYELLRDLMQQSINSSRQIAFQLRSDLLQSVGLLQAIENLVSQFRASAGNRGQLELAPGWEEPISTSLAGNIYRSVQELLNNMAKHAEATTFIVRLQHVGLKYRVEVADDGLGIRSPSRQGHLGLHTLRERVEAHQGTMEVKTRPEVDGTRVTLIFLQRTPDAPDTNFQDTDY